MSRGVPNRIRIGNKGINASNFELANLAVALQFNHKTIKTMLLLLLILKILKLKL
jgi:hypothetical protein